MSETDELVGRWEHVERWHWRYWIGTKSFTLRFDPGKNFNKLNGWNVEWTGYSFPTRLAAANWIDWETRRKIDAYHGQSV